jgi:hypothetical protein
MQNQNSRPKGLVVLVAILLGLVVAFHLGNALVGKSLFRAIHLGTALEYAHGPVNLLRPIIVGFDANDAPMAQEPPFWQAAVGLVFKATGSTWYGWANLVSLLFFATGLWPAFQLARCYVSERAAWWSMAFFLAQPLIVFVAGLGSTDVFCLVVMNWFLFFANRMIVTGRAFWWLPAALFASLCAVSKLPFFMTAGIASVFMLVVQRAWSWRLWLLLASVGMVAAGAFAEWTHYTDALSAHAEYPYVELRLAHNPFIRDWYFGNLQFRLNPGAWIKGCWRFLHATLGSLPFVVLLLTALFRPGNRFPKLWLAAMVPTILVFTHLMLVHSHYYLMCCLPVAVLCGTTLAAWEDLWAQQMPRSGLRLSLAGLALVLSAVDGLIALKISVYYDPYPEAMGAIIRQYTKPEDRLVVYGADWGGEELFRAERMGFCVHDLQNVQGADTTRGLYDLLDNETDLHRLKTLGYNKLVLISESPAWFAAMAVNPGSKIKRDLYPATISPTVDRWPVVYRSEDILIKDIPDK